MEDKEMKSDQKIEVKDVVALISTDDILNRKEEKSMENSKKINADEVIVLDDADNIPEQSAEEKSNSGANIVWVNEEKAEAGITIFGIKFSLGVQERIGVHISIRHDEERNGKCHGQD